MLASWVSLQYKVYENFVKFATFKISYLKKRKWRKLMLMNTFCVWGKAKKSIEFVTLMELSLQARRRQTENHLGLAQRRQIPKFQHS